MEPHRPQVIPNSEDRLSYRGARRDRRGEKYALGDPCDLCDAIKSSSELGTIRSVVCHYVMPDIEVDGVARE